MNTITGNAKILQDIRQDMSVKSELEQLRAENARLKAAAAARSQGPSIRIKVKTAEEGGKGTVCVYGLGRFPVSLYAGTWVKLAKLMPEILAYIESQPYGMATRDED